MRKSTEKMKALLEEEQRKREEKFTRTSGKWKEQVKATRARLKNECAEGELGEYV